MELASDLSSGSNIVEMLPDLRVFWVVSVTEQTFPRRRCHTYIHRWVYAFAHIVHVNGYGCDCVLLEANGKYPDKNWEARLPVLSPEKSGSKGSGASSEYHLKYRCVSTVD